MRGGLGRGGRGRGATPPRKELDLPHEPTPPEVVDATLALADVGSQDVVYDLGCGDGRIVVAAAKRGARAVGVDIDPERIREARANARAAGVGSRVEFRGDRSSKLRMASGNGYSVTWTRAVR